MSVDEEILEPIVADHLTPLGLDPEIYGAYILPLLASDDAEDWESILELLKASSETHGDNEEVWDELKSSLKEAYAKELSKQNKQKESEQAKEREEYQKNLEADREAARLAEIEKQAESEGQKAIDDATKLALMARFGYEDDENAAEPDETVESNRDVASRISQQQSQNMRSKAQGSKKEEQEKTAKAKKDMIQQKEERRKRAVKGERRR